MPNMASTHPDTPRPKLFVGSSPAGREIVDRLAADLIDLADVTTWCEGLASPPPAPGGFDAAAFALCGAPEWSLFLRLGVFLGTLGRERIIVVPSESRAGYVPSELGGLFVATEAAAIKEQLSRLAATLPVKSPVARRRRRSLGEAAAFRPGQPLRIADISLTGALLESYGEIPENQMLDLELALDNGRRIRVAAKVVRVQHPQWGRVGGVGVQFTRFEGDSYAILQQFLDVDPGAATP
jgi:hypothetical protein